MRIIYVALIAIFIFACSKSSKKQEEVTVCPEPMNLNWLHKLKNEYQSCVCLTGFRTGIYQNQQVIEIYGFDPLCNGINMVYKIDGTRWFISADEIYKDYQKNVKDQQVIWTCSKEGGK